MEREYEDDFNRLVVYDEDNPDAWIRAERPMGVQR